MMSLNETLNGLNMFLNGYGQNYFIDLQEIYFEMKLCNYKDDFINDFISFAFKFNTVQSVIETE